MRPFLLGVALGVAFLAGWAAACFSSTRRQEQGRSGDLGCLACRGAARAARLRALRARARAGACACSSATEVLFGLSSQAMALAESGAAWAEDIETTFCGAGGARRESKPC